MINHSMISDHIQISLPQMLVFSLRGLWGSWDILQVVLLLIWTNLCPCMDLEWVGLIRGLLVVAHLWARTCPSQVLLGDLLFPHLHLEIHFRPLLYLITLRWAGATIQMVYQMTAKMEPLVEMELSEMEVQVILILVTYLPLDLVQIFSPTLVHP
jgi:hypothetical protein